MIAATKIASSIIHMLHILNFLILWCLNHVSRSYILKSFYATKQDQMYLPVIATTGEMREKYKFSYIGVHYEVIKNSIVYCHWHCKIQCWRWLIGNIPASEDTKMCIVTIEQPRVRPLSYWKLQGQYGGIHISLDINISLFE